MHNKSVKRSVQKTLNKSKEPQGGAIMKVNSINLNTNYKPLSFRSNDANETQSPVQATLQGPVPVDVLQFKQAVKVNNNSFVSKIAEAVKGFMAKPADNVFDYWDPNMSFEEIEQIRTALL